MKRFIRIDRLLLAAALTAVVAAQVAQAGPLEPVVPARIKVEDGNKLFLVGHAVGFQIYSCNTTASGYRWEFVAPRADLYDGNGKRLAIHFAGPTWQAKDGSYVVGQRVDGITVDPTAIPWLLLSAASSAVGSEGDRLSDTTFIQRIATTGGLAPASAGCNDGTVGSRDEVPYTADYYFWKAIGP